MFEEPAAAGFALRCHDAGEPAPVLTGVAASGRLDAVLFELTVRQTYRNTSERVLEVLYTFPLPSAAVLLGFASELNGRRMEGAIVARPDAERRYEKALAEGDAPVMLQALGGGLHTANIGNLKPGDEVVLEVRYAQTLAFEQGRLRLSIPTTIAPRYGSAERGGGLQPQQVPVHSLQAQYPLRLSLALGPALAGAAVACPTHKLAPAEVKGAAKGVAKGIAKSADAAADRHGGAVETHYELAAGAWLDRDVVVTVTPREPRPSLVVRATDSADPEAPVVLMAALQPATAAPRERIALKLLVDCSGSMAGDGISSARAALRGLAARLSAQDRVSLSRFGSTVEHVLALSELTPATLRRLQPLIDQMQADLGGTEMEAALTAVFALGGGIASRTASGAKAATPGEEPGRDVLLITDGEIWSAEAVVAAARRSAHRVFAIGVGAAPAEGVLRPLVEATGGMCEFATPGEALEAAAQRMLQRIRQPVWRDVRVDWGREPAWQVGPGVGVFGGDTVLAMAGFRSAAGAGATQAAPAVRLMCEGGEAGAAAQELARGEADAPAAGDSVARLAAAQRMGLALEANDEPAALALALRYQLMSRQTHCILVHERVAAEKAAEAAEAAELHRVPAMVAAGWGGTGTVMSVAMPMAAQASYGGLAGMSDMLVKPTMSRRASFSRAAQEPRQLAEPPVEALARAVGRHFATGGELPDLAAHCAALLGDGHLRGAFAEVALLGLTRDEACLALAQWANSRAGGLADTTLAAQLRPHLDALDPDQLARALEVFERLLQPLATPGAAASRTQRLLRALRGA